jgi:hypothetical protein
MVTCVYSQQNPKNNFTETKAKTFAIEIVQHKNVQLVFDTKSKRMQLATRFLNKQYTVNYSPQYRGNKFKLDSDLELNNEHNKSLSTDVYYRPKIYNPLKYMFPMYFIYNEKCRSENTDYVITVQKLN